MDTRSVSTDPSAPLSQLEVPTELQNTADFNSRASEPNASRDASPDDKSKDFYWTKFPGFQIPPTSKRDRRSHIWEHCHEIYHTRTTKVYAVCKLCDQKYGTKYGIDYR